jgi:mannosyltransferase OCH1-like enzyme
MIPRMIHQMWIGPKPAPSEMIQTWINLNPGWTHILWTESLIKQKYPSGFKNQKHIDEHETYNGKCDIMRYEILFDHGGFFIDADAICLNSLDDHFLEHDSFTCYENESVRKDLLATGYMGSVKNCELMRLCVNHLTGTQSVTKNSTGKPSWMTVGPLFFTNIVKAYNYPIKVYPSYTFIPTHHSGVRYTGKEKVYADQKWGSTFGYENIRKP